MARHHRSVALAHRPSVVVVRAPGRARRAARRVGHAVRHGGRRLAHHGKKALPTLGVVVGAAVGGFLEGKGLLNKLPAIGGSKVITLAAIGYAATRFSKTPAIRQGGLAALAVAAFDFARVQAGGTSGFDDVEGDGGAGPQSGMGY